MKVFPNVGRILVEPLSYLEFKDKYLDYESNETKGRLRVCRVLLHHTQPHEDIIGDYKDEPSEYEDGDTILVDLEASYKLKIDGKERYILFEDDVLAKVKSRLEKDEDE